MCQTSYNREALGFYRNCCFTANTLRTLSIYHTFYTILDCFLILLSMYINNSFIITFIIIAIKNIRVNLNLLIEIHHIIILIIRLVISLVLLFLINRLLYVLINIKNYWLSWSYYLISNCFFHKIYFTLPYNFH